MRKQEPPFTVKIEFTEGCNLKCSFCGIHGIREKPGNFKCLTVKLAKRIARQIYLSGWNAKIECAMHGEPLMNPNYLEIIRAIKAECPNQLMVSTNSIGLARPPGIHQSILNMFDAGLDLLVIDCYDMAEKVWSQIPGMDLGDIILTKYPGGPSPNKRFPKKDKRIVMIEDLGHALQDQRAIKNEGDFERMKGKLGNRIISNHAGAAGPLDESLPWAKRCARPFRELSIRWNGKVSLCCNDWRGEYRCGDLKKDDMLKIWNGPEFSAARKALYNRDREAIEVCSKCDNVSFRVGLLPDKLGKETLRKPTKKDRAIIASSEKGRTMTPIVLRPWEGKK